MKKSKKLIFFGTEDFSQASLVRLIASSLNTLISWNLVALVTKPDAPAGRGQEEKAPSVIYPAKQSGLRIFQPKKLLDIKQDLLNLKPTHGILVAYGKIIPQEIIDIFPGGIINVHPSLLPKYRGPSPIETAILKGDKQTGISLMKITAGMDEGPVYAQKKIKIIPNADKGTFGLYLASAGADFLLEKLPEIIKGGLTPKPQDNSRATYTKLLKKEDGIVDWDKPAKQLEQEIRAYQGWPRSRAKLFGKEIVITKARVARDQNDGDLVIKCRRGWLEIQELTAPSGRTISGADFMRGYHK